MARALATANLSPSEACFAFKRARVDLDAQGEVARAEVLIELFTPAPLSSRKPEALRGLVNPDGAHPLMAWLPGAPEAGLPPFFMDLLPLSRGRASARGGPPLPAGMDPEGPLLCEELAEARRAAEGQGKRLPTEAEFRSAWGPAPLPWGEVADPSCGRVGRPRYDRLPELGMHPPSPAGLFDLGAWLWQWLDDGRVAGGSMSRLVSPPEGCWPIGIRLVQDA